MFDKQFSVCIMLLLSIMLNQNLFAQNSTNDLPYSVPQEVEELHPRFHFAPVNQDTTKACWSYSTLSFIESEIQRLNGQSVKLAVMYPVYYGFIEKAIRFVETQSLVTVRCIDAAVQPTNAASSVDRSSL